MEQVLYYCQQKQLIFPWEFSKLLQHIFLETALFRCVLPFSHFYILTVMLRIGLRQKLNLIDVNTTWIVYFKREQLTFACLFLLKQMAQGFILYYQSAHLQTLRVLIFCFSKVELMLMEDFTAISFFRELV